MPPTQQVNLNVKPSSSFRLFFLFVSPSLFYIIDCIRSIYILLTLQILLFYVTIFNKVSTKIHTNPISQIVYDCIILMTNKQSNKRLQRDRTGVNGTVRGVISLKPETSYNTRRVPIIPLPKSRASFQVVCLMILAQA